MWRGSLFPACCEMACDVTVSFMVQSKPLAFGFYGVGAEIKAGFELDGGIDNASLPSISLRRDFSRSP